MCETPGKMRMPEIVKIYLTVSEIVWGGERWVYIIAFCSFRVLKYHGLYFAKLVI